MALVPGQHVEVDRRQTGLLGNLTPSRFGASVIIRWASGLSAEVVAAIYGRFAPGRSLADDFRVRFGQELDEDTLNQSHQVVVATLDDSTEHIIAYLAKRGIPINALLFQVVGGPESTRDCGTASAARYAAGVPVCMSVLLIEAREMSVAIYQRV